MVVGNINTNGVPFSTRNGNGSPSNSNGSATNGSGNGTVPSDLFGLHSFPNGVAAHNFINAALNTGNNIGAVAAATSMSSRGMMRNVDTLRSYNGSNGGIRGQIQSNFPGNGFGNPVSIHPMAPPANANVRRFHRSPRPASALIVVAEVQDLPRSGRPSMRTRSPLLGWLGPSSQSSTSSFGSGASGNSCECEECRNCVCSLYCHEHAALNCPVHGRGLHGHSSGSDEEHLYPGSSQESVFPPTPPGSF